MTNSRRSPAIGITQRPHALDLLGTLGVLCDVRLVMKKKKVRYLMSVVFLVIVGFCIGVTYKWQWRYMTWEYSVVLFNVFCTLFPTLIWRASALDANLDWPTGSCGVVRCYDWISG